MTSAPIPKLPVVVASDHAGLESKQAILESISADGFPVEDLGPATAESVDYPDFAAAVGKRIEEGTASFGVLVCGTGTGMALNNRATLTNGSPSTSIGPGWTASTCDGPSRKRTRK